MAHEKITLTQIIETLDEWEIDIKFDLKSDWCENKSQFRVHLIQVQSANAILKRLMNEGDEIFSSSISK